MLSTFSLVFWWFGNALEALLLFKSFKGKGKLYKEYPVFYTYILCVLFIEILRFSIFIGDNTAFKTAYRAVYWPTDFVLVALGFGVVLEVFMKALAHYPGVARLARNLLLIVLMIVAVSALLGLFRDSSGSVREAAAAFERNLRAILAIILVAALMLFSYFLIPMGRNLRGIMFGYTFYIAMSVINLTYFSHLSNGATKLVWNYLARFSYHTALMIWCLTLWSYAPNPVPCKDSRVEREYEFIVAQVRNVLARIRKRIRGLEL